ncbi:hypothetical protein [Halorarum halobium]|uniref:hypothetical protein n=1 Tax=Halorarum halobium TaxID=3075121 RepID=UPI0028AD55E1|nr:hypothetical protein [Halobaculum sp. XH14]
MADPNQEVLEELRHGGRSMLIEEVVSLLERTHRGDRPGVSRETVTAYADALEEDPEQRFDRETFHEELEASLTDSDTWEDPDSLYRIGDGHLSCYPPVWHGRLGGTTDVRAYVEFLQEEAPEFDDGFERGGAGEGIPQQPLLDVVATVGRVDRGVVKAELKELRQRGELVEDADQHPNAGVMLRDDGGEQYRDTSLDT